MSNIKWIIIDIDRHGTVERRTTNNPLPRSGDTHFHVEDGKIIAIHTLESLENQAKESLAEYWALVNSGTVRLGQRRKGESRYDLPLLDMLWMIRHQEKV